MGYLFLALALAAGITKGYCGKKTSFAIKSNSHVYLSDLRSWQFRVILHLSEQTA